MKRRKERLPFQFFFKITTLDHIRTTQPTPLTGKKKHQKTPQHNNNKKPQQNKKNPKNIIYPTSTGLILSQQSRHIHTMYMHVSISFSSCFYNDYALFYIILLNHVIRDAWRTFYKDFNGSKTSFGYCGTIDCGTIAIEKITQLYCHK